MENQLVTVMKFTKLYAVRFVKEKLEFEGIECFLTDEGFGRIKTELSLGWNLKVKANDVERTVKILMQINKAYDLTKIHKNSTIKDLKKVLVPIDLYNYSLNTCKYLFGITEKINIEIKFLYVLDDSYLASPVKYTKSWEEHEKIEKAEAYKKAQSKLLEFSDDFKKQIPKHQLEKAKFHFAMHTGKLENTIVALSQRYTPDVIIMAQKARDTKEREHFAKVDQYIIEHTKFPVLIIPEAAVYTDIDKIRIMYATDFHDADHTSLDKLIEIVKPFETKIHCIQIDAEHDLVKQSKVDEIDQLLKKEYSNYDIQANIYEPGNFPLGIEEFIEKNQIDLISLSSPRRNFIYKIFHPDILHKMILASKVPMLIFPIP